ncbi:MAG: protein kinase [Parasporobacterium sp.]|nr:protein kinase [Parasporobacterium sp.]MBQ9032963.1 protein kinase [Parasporobacterium sp.]
MENEILTGIWPEWKVVRQIGSGSFGTVYEVARTDSLTGSHSAVKVIQIPQNDAELGSLRDSGLTEDDTRQFMESFVNDFVREIEVMESLKALHNIVSVEDYKVVKRTDRIGWKIFIRMELLTPLTTYIRDNPLTEDRVIKLGCDLCTALTECEKESIIHRDIKPGNIFVNKHGDFKLGDFGIARRMENTTGGLSHKGTYNYMAPEVQTPGPYDSRVDIYSLGLVLYQYLNQGRLPFLNSEQQVRDHNAHREALNRRLSGEMLPPPCNASPALADVVLRACAFDPDRRFATARDMKRALTQAANGTYRPSDQSTSSISLSDFAIPPSQQNKNAALRSREAALRNPPIRGEAQAPSRFVPASGGGAGVGTGLGAGIGGSTGMGGGVGVRQQPPKPKSPIVPILLVISAILILAGGYFALIYLNVLPDSLSLLSSGTKEQIGSSLPETEEYEEYFKVILYQAPDSQLPLMAEPDSGSQKYTSINANALLAIDKVSGGWGHTEYEGRAGWVALRYTKAVDGYSAAEPEGELEQEQTYVVYNTGYQGLTVRSRATEDSCALDTIPDGTSVTASALENGWAYVTYGDHSGWVSTTFLR